MKLNHDCVRDLLLFIEENVTYGTYALANSIELPGYTQDEIVYAAEKLAQADYLDAEVSRFLDRGTPDVHITSITWEGHKFLDNIRDDGVWKQTKGVLSKLSSASLSIASNVAAQVISNLVKTQMGL
ncbi:DUF2513 domain-containing protein [Hominibacterium faecale]|uniref:DUF2513 domain-containing protein n=1 Tax=Hominibacterium faecale TaxID=2839743 RepID=UPI0022B2A928|nr:DUF2513 domain-containing protein [Hominibacterium faecale]